LEKLPKRFRRTWDVWNVIKDRVKLRKLSRARRPAGLGAPGDGRVGIVGGKRLHGREWLL